MEHRIILNNITSENNMERIPTLTQALVLISSPFIATWVKILADKTLSPHEKASYGACSIFTGTMLAGYFYYDRHLSFYETSLLTMAITPVAFSLITVIAENSKIVAKQIFGKLTNVIIQKIESFSTKKVKDGNTP